MTRGNLPTIDVHAHALLPVWISALAKATGQTAGSVKFADAPLPDWSGASVLSLMAPDLGPQVVFLGLPIPPLTDKEQPPRSGSGIKPQRGAECNRQPPGAGEGRIKIASPLTCTPSTAARSVKSGAPLCLRRTHRHRR
jgi:hypothetical protein